MKKTAGEEVESSRFFLQRLLKLEVLEVTEKSPVNKTNSVESCLTLACFAVPRKHVRQVECCLCCALVAHTKVCAAHILNVSAQQNTALCTQVLFEILVMGTAAGRDFVIIVDPNCIMICE